MIYITSPLLKTERFFPALHLYANVFVQFRPFSMKKSLLRLGNPVDPDKHTSGREDLVKLLQKHFGYSNFRGKQLEAIEAVLSGTDCFCLMPTGGGKSLCYQIPALARTGIVLVICPLIALMENQVSILKEKGISAEYLSSAQMPHIKQKIHEDLDSGKPSLRLLYVTPELVATSGFMSKLSKLYTRGLLKLIAIDEAHCISTWGHDFRPSYRKLSSLRKHLPAVPILALTATAGPKVQKDVINSLCLQHPTVLNASFNRPNIFYEVRYKDLLDDAYIDLLHILKSTGDVCSIIYCLERTACDDLSARLSKDGISCGAYHSGLNNKVRSCVLDDWISSKIQVVVATVAFGMGIDRRDVRIVCHFNIPKSMEAFYQESGRAGRDGLLSRSLLYYGLDDRRRMEYILKNSANSKANKSDSQDGLPKKSLADFTQMVEYCEGSGCRRKKILGSFGEQAPASLCGKSCDACKHPNIVSKYLEELSHVPSIHQWNGPSPIFIDSSSLMAAEDLETEFWNRNDETTFSSEDISDSDDGVEVANNLVKEKFSSKSGMSEKVEILLRAEESYYHRDGSNTKTSSPINKKAISQALRDASKQRLFNALNQAQQRLGNPMIELQAATTMLEQECYKKYGKIGKTFYNSQVASTIRWLSSSSFSEISNRLGTDSTKVSDSCVRDSGANISPSPLPNSAGDDHRPEEVSFERIQAMVELENSSDKSAQMGGKPQEIELPSIPSFSEFVNQKGKKDELEHHARRDGEKRIRLK